MDVHELVVAQWDDGTVITSVVRRVASNDSGNHSGNHSGSDSNDSGSDTSDATVHHFRVLRDGQVIGEAETVRAAALLAGHGVPASS